MSSQGHELLETRTLLDGVALNTSQTSTETHVAGFNSAWLYVEHTNNTATALQVLVEYRPAGSTAWYDLPTATVGGGSVALSGTGNYTRTVSADDEYAISLTNLNAQELRVTASATGGSATDFATVKIALGTV